LSFLGSNKIVLPVYKNMPKQSLDKTVNIMLTPQFYTVKKEKLPLKYTFQVKKIVASMFDGLLDSSKKYDYMVYKEGDLWVCIAYSLEEIENFLFSKDIKYENINKIFFAEQSQKLFTAPVLLGTKDALVSIDNFVVIVPQVALLDNVEILNIDEQFIPKHGISMHSSSHSLIGKKYSIGFSVLFTVFAIIFVVEGWQLENNLQIFQKIQKLKDEYPTLKSDYTRKSIVQKYRAIDKIERKKRDIVKSLAGLIFKGVKIEIFKMNEKRFVVRFQCSNAKVAKRLKDLAKKAGFNSVKTLTGNIVNIEEKF